MRVHFVAPMKRFLRLGLVKIGAGAVEYEIRVDGARTLAQRQWNHRAVPA